MNRAAASSSAIRREEEGWLALLNLDHFNGRVKSKVFRRCVALPLWRTLNANRGWTLRKEAVRVGFRRHNGHLAPHERRKALRVRRRLRDQFEITLPRFDLLAQLDRAPNGMTLGELSQRMMVSNGNITGLVERLAEQGLIRRRPLPNDRRVQIVSLTPEGQKFFRSMARVNADWVGEIFAGLAPKDIEALMPLLAKTKQSARKALKNGGVA